MLLVGNILVALAAPVVRIDTMVKTQLTFITMTFFAIGSANNYYLVY